MNSLTLNPIGFIRTNMRLKFDTPHQPKNSSDLKSVVELLPNLDFEQALRDLSGFDRIWLVWWFHKNESWKPMVLPPRGNAQKRGVFATRAPYRPNPIGISAVPLLKVSGRKLIVGNSDLLDGTPILDIKPYISEVDSFPDASSGWLSDLEAQLKGEPAYNVKLNSLAAAQLEWLKDNYSIEIFEKALRILERDPHPHRTRRISKSGSNLFRMGCGAWRIYFSIAENEVLVERIECGYPERALLSERQGGSNAEIPHREAQVGFLRRWKVYASHK